MLARFLVEALDDLHRRQHFGHHRADVGHAVLAGTADRAQAASEDGDGDGDRRDDQEQAQRQAGDQREEVDRAAHRDEEIAQRDRNGGAHDLLDQRGIAGHAARNFLGAVLFVEARCQAQEVGLYPHAHVGDHAFAQPADEIEPRGRAHGEHADDQQQVLEPAADITAVAGKAAVDHQLEACRNGQRGGRRHDQRHQRHRHVAGIFARFLEHHAQGLEAARFRVLVAAEQLAALLFVRTRLVHAGQLGSLRRKIHRRGAIRALLHVLCIAQRPIARQTALFSRSARSDNTTARAAGDADALSRL